MSIYENNSLGQGNTNDVILRHNSRIPFEGLTKSKCPMQGAIFSVDAKQARIALFRNTNKHIAIEAWRGMGKQSVL
jgi:hypothetical protein